MRVALPHSDGLAFAFLNGQEDTTMDNRTERGRQDRDRINLKEDYEVQYWTKALGVTREQLEDAVRRVGVMAKDVRAALGKQSS